MRFCIFSKDQILLNFASRFILCIYIDIYIYDINNVIQIEVLSIQKENSLSGVQLNAMYGTMVINLSSLYSQISPCGIIPIDQ